MYLGGASNARHRASCPTTGFTTSQNNTNHSLRAHNKHISGAWQAHVKHMPNRAPGVAGFHAEHFPAKLDMFSALCLPFRGSGSCTELISGNVSEFGFYLLSASNMSCSKDSRSYLFTSIFGHCFFMAGDASSMFPGAAAVGIQTREGVMASHVCKLHLLRTGPACVKVGRNAGQKDIDLTCLGLNRRFSGAWDRRGCGETPRSEVLLHRLARRAGGVRRRARGVRPGLQGRGGSSERSQRVNCTFGCSSAVRPR